MVIGDAIMRSRYVVVDVKGVVALGIFYSLIVVADVSWIVRRHLSKLAKAGTESQADSIAVASLKNSGM